MQWFIIGRDMHVLCIPSSELRKTLPIDDSSGGQEITITNNCVTGTYDFITSARHSDSVHIKEGNYVAFKDKYGKTRLYTIMTVDGDTELQVHCEDIGLDLINEDAEAWDYTNNPKTITETLEPVLHDTGWEIGVNEVGSTKIATKFDSITDSWLTRLGDVCAAFDCECDFEIKMEGSKVTSQKINIYKSIGEDKTQQNFIDDINLIALRRSGSIKELCTCMRCYGRENSETGQKLTIADIVYDDGRYFTKKGDIRIYDREGWEKWSRFRAFSDYSGYGDEDGRGYINGTFEYDTDNAQELFNKGLEELKDRGDVKVTYEVSLYDLRADIGDTVRIADNRKAEKIYLSARVQEVTNYYTVKGKDTGILANYVLLSSKPTQSVMDLLNELKGQLVAIKSTTVHYQIGTSGTEQPTGEWLEYIPATEPGDYLWTRAVTIYTNGSSSTSYSVSRNGENGLDGKDGKDGADGLPGADGADGQTSYFHVKYSSVPNPTSSSQMSETPAEYIGTYVDFSYADSDDPSVYTWARFQGLQGENGEQGIPGTNGIDGKTSYLHIKYSDDGGITFTDDNGETPGDWLGQYVDFTQADSSDPTDYVWKLIKGDPGPEGPRGLQGLQGETGEQGIPGKDGKDGRTSYTHIAYANSADGETDFSVSDPNRKYIGMYVDFTATDSDDPADYLWSLIKGADGATGIPGKNGADGKTAYLHIAYSNSADGHTGFSTTDSAGKSYIGQYTDNTASDSTDPDDYSWTKIKGEDGVGISGVTEHYAVSSSNTTAPTSWQSTVPTMTTTNRYLWNYETIQYTDGTSKDSAKRVIGVYGNTGATGGTGATGNGISSIVNHYLASASASGVTTGTSGWTTTVQTTTTSKKYLWNYETIHYTNGSSTNTTPCIIGTHGETGPAGKGIASITEQYYLSTSKETPTGGSWVTTPPQWVAGKYIWTRSKIVYVNPASTEYTAPVCDSSWEAVNEIEIGGRNLLLNSKNGYSLTGSDTSEVVTYSGNKLTTKTGATGNAYRWVQSLLTIDPEEIQKKIGDVYTYSLEVRVKGSFSGLYSFVDIRQGSTKALVARANIPNNCKKNEWFRVNGTGTVVDTSGVITTQALLIFAWDSSTAGSTVEWRLHKLEKGNKATDWTPAPEDNIESVDVEYYLSTSTTSLSGGSWSTVAPQWVNGKYMWSRVKTIYKDGTTSYSDPTCIAGAKGATGATGPTGPQGATGATGNGISTVTNYYLATTAGSGVTTSTSGWTTTVQTVTATKKYLWNYEVVKYTNGSSAKTTPHVIGVYGDKGVTGATGPTGPQGATGPKGDKGDGLDVKDTRNDNQPPSWYMSNYPRTTVMEFKNCSSIGISGVGTYCSLQTVVPWHDASGGYPKQTAKVEGTGKEYWRVGTGASTWSSWVDPLGNALDAKDTADDANDKITHKYGTCGTGAGTAAKVVTLSGFKLYTGATIAVRFTYANTAASPTLNVNGTGAKAIYTMGTRYAYWSAGATVMFTYDGSYWRVCSEPVYASTATIGNPGAFNVYVDKSTVNVRNASKNLATFREDGIDLVYGKIWDAAGQITMEVKNVPSGHELGVAAYYATGQRDRLVLKGEDIYAEFYKKDREEWEFRRIGLRGEFTSDEVYTGDIWYDGSEIYQKTIHVGAITSGQQKVVAHGISGVKEIWIDLGNSFLKSSSGTTYMLPRATQASLNQFVEPTVNKTNVVIAPGNDANFSDCYITVRYTKN